MQYWCEKEKQRLKEIYSKNKQTYQEMLQVTFNSQAMFKKRTQTLEQEHVQSENTQIVGYKEPIIKRILNKILEILHLK